MDGIPIIIPMNIVYPTNTVHTASSGHIYPCHVKRLIVLM